MGIILKLTFLIPMPDGLSSTDFPGLVFLSLSASNIDFSVLDSFLKS